MRGNCTIEPMKREYQKRSDQTGQQHRFFNVATVVADQSEKRLRFAKQRLNPVNHILHAWRSQRGRSHSQALRTQTSRNPVGKSPPASRLHSKPRCVESGRLKGTQPTGFPLKHPNFSWAAARTAAPDQQTEMRYQRIQRTAHPGFELMPGRDTKGNLADLDGIEQRLDCRTRPATGCLPVDRQFLQIGRPWSAAVHRHREDFVKCKIGLAQVWHTMGVPQSMRLNGLSLSFSREGLLFSFHSTGEHSDRPLNLPRWSQATGQPDQSRHPRIQWTQC